MSKKYDPENSNPLLQERVVRALERLTGRQRKAGPVKVARTFLELQEHSQELPLSNSVASEDPPQEPT